MDAMEPAAVVAAVAARIDRKSSIESEPRTLRVDQIQFAREAAEYVVNSRSTGEALTIFTAGLKPVACARTAVNADAVMDPEDKYFGHGASSFQWPEPRDVLSAPF